MNVGIPVEGTLGLRLRGARLRMAWSGWLIRVVGLGYLLWAILRPGMDSFDALLIALGVLFLGFPEYVGLIGHLKAKKFGPVLTYTLTDEVLRETSRVTTAELRWSLLKSIRENRTLWQLRFTGGVGVTLPKDAFTPEQDAEWRAFTATRAIDRLRAGWRSD
jgi:hypothetical protein